MNVLALTILISVCLAAIFIVCFIGELRKPRKRGIEHHALMPLEDDSSEIKNTVATPTTKATTKAKTKTTQQEKI